MTTVGKVLKKLYTVEGITLGRNTREFVEEAASRFKPDCTVLDLGCGEGEYSVLLAKLGFKVTASDRSEDMIKKTEELAKEEKVEITFLRGDATNPNDFSQLGKFDDIICLNLLQQLLLEKKDINRVINQMKYQTNPRGYNVILTFEGTMEENRPYVPLFKPANMLEQILKQKYCHDRNWSLGYTDFNQFWGDWEDHRGKLTKHKHYLLQLIAKKL